MTNSQYQLEEFAGCLIDDHGYHKGLVTDSPPEFMDLGELVWTTDNYQPNPLITNYSIPGHGYNHFHQNAADMNNNCINLDDNIDLNYSDDSHMQDYMTTNISTYNLETSDQGRHDFTSHPISNEIISGNYGSLDNDCDRFHVQSDFNGSAKSHAVQVSPSSHYDNYLPALNTPKKRGRKPLKQTEEEREMKRKSSNRMSQKKARDRREREKDDLRNENEKLRLELGTLR